MAVGTGVRGHRRADLALTAALLSLAAVAWVSTVRLTAGMAGAASMAMAFGPYAIAWLAMMTAMMLPAVTPVVRLYARAAALGRVAPAWVFATGYLVVWLVAGIPAYAVWRGALMIGAAGTGVLTLTGAVLIVVGVYQLTPWKSACLRRCRSPLGFFLQARGNLRKPLPALRAGAHHGLFCLGCCWALMLLLVTVGAMQPGWTLAIAVLVFLERNARFGPRLTTGSGVALALTGSTLLLLPVHQLFVS